jgi:NADH-quinone oxidoreductase subunit L
VVSFLTAFYTGRLLFMTFFGNLRVPAEARRHLHEPPAVMLAPLVLLALLACAGGAVPVPAVVTGHAQAEHTPLAFMAVATALAAGGLTLAYVLYVRRPDLPPVLAERLGGLYTLVRDKFRVDELYDAVVVRPVFSAAELSARRIDPGVIDGAVNGAGLLVAATSGLWRRLQTGNVQHYALSFLLGALVLLGYYVAR